MRTSSQLTNSEQCGQNPKANITQTTDNIIRASAQKEVILRVLKGEPILDIRGELDNILISKNCLWENTEQKNVNLALYNARIQRFLAYENWRRGTGNYTYIYPDNIDSVVDFFGEPIQVEADYFVLNDENNEVIVTKIKTSRFTSEDADIESNEAYALGLLGEKLFPEKTIKVQFPHLADKDNKIERQQITKFYTDTKKISTLLFDDKAKAFFQAKYEAEQESKNDTTNHSDCVNCAMYNVCYFEEPPISIDIVKEVKPISEIRLTAAQREVVNYEEGVARINAGAGAGKTLVVAMRVVELLRKGYQPEDICLLTFTNTGADEMTARIVQYCAGYGLLIDPARLTSTTFNAFCQNLVTTHYEELGYLRPPRVIPDETRSGIINRLLDQFPHIPEWNYAGNSSGQYAKYGLSALNMAKMLFAEIKKEGYTRLDNPYLQKYQEVSLDLLFQMYEEYNNQLFSRGLLEYDDQILKTFELLRIHPTLFDEIGFKHIIVDEFQDTDLPQINLLNEIIDTASFKSFMAVGDDSQSIFAFRHTSPEYMINFGSYFGHFDDFSLVDNHRSNGKTIDFANKINALNENRVEKDLLATKPPGETPVIKGFYSQKSEYEWVANQIKKRIEDGATPSDIAFLASDRKELTQMASILTKMGIPSVLMNPIPFISNSRVAALCTFFDGYISGSTRGFMDYQNVINHGALKGAKAEDVERISKEFAEEIHSGDKSLSRFIEYARLLDIEEADECYQDFLEKVTFCESMDELTEFFRDFKLYGSESMFKREGKYEGVCLTTVHSAKGSEWDTVYLSLSHFDKEEYHRFSSRYENSGEKEENNRKWFVGATRAREELIMTGEFVLKFTQKECILNEYIKKAYNLLGKAYTYSPTAYWETRDNEKRETLARILKQAELLSTKTKELPSLNKGTVNHKSSDLLKLYGDKYQKPRKDKKEKNKTDKPIEDLSVDDIEFV